MYINTSWQGGGQTGSEAVLSAWTQVNEHNLKPMKFHLNRRKTFYCEGSRTLSWVAQRDCVDLHVLTWAACLQLALLGAGGLNQIILRDALSMLLFCDACQCKNPVASSSLPPPDVLPPELSKEYR